MYFFFAFLSLYPRLFGVPYLTWGTNASPFPDVGKGRLANASAFFFTVSPWLLSFVILLRLFLRGLLQLLAEASLTFSLCPTQGICQDSEF